MTARAAISADGRYVAFRTTQASDLPAEAAPATPTQQVFVRDRLERRTRLVTRDQTTGEPAGGALAAAVISADGSTVSWVGRSAPAQTRFVPGEVENPFLEYLLWRRVADGDLATTRRVSGVTDVDDPGCPPGATVVDDPAQTGPCYGPLGVPDGYVGGLVNSVPALSADGRRVAFVTNAYGRGVAATGNAGDVWIADMSPGVSRKSGTVELTRDVGAGSATNAPIDGVALSADGRWLLFTSFRTTFGFGGLTLTSAPRPAALARELYLVDLVDARDRARVVRVHGGRRRRVSRRVSRAERRRRAVRVPLGVHEPLLRRREQPPGRVRRRPARRAAARAGPPDAPGAQQDEAPVPDPEEPPPGRLTVRTSSRAGGTLRFIVRAPSSGHAARHRPRAPARRPGTSDGVGADAGERAPDRPPRRERDDRRAARDAVPRSPAQRRPDRRAGHRHARDRGRTAVRAARAERAVPPVNIR